VRVTVVYNLELMCFPSRGRTRTASGRLIREVCASLGSSFIYIQAKHIKASGLHPAVARKP
jgi:hypothetical protein